MSQIGEDRLKTVSSPGNRLLEVDKKYLTYDGQNGIIPIVER